MKLTHFLKIATFLLLTMFLSIVSAEAAGVTCNNFSRTLDIGDYGDDVYCLQKRLNASGFIVSEVGDGAIGNETKYYGVKTSDAVKSWQKAQGIRGATGYFGKTSKVIANTNKTDGWYEIEERPNPDSHIIAIAYSLEEKEVLLKPIYTNDDRETDIQPTTKIEDMTDDQKLSLIETLYGKNSEIYQLVQFFISVDII